MLFIGSGMKMLTLFRRRNSLEWPNMASVAELQKRISPMMLATTTASIIPSKVMVMVELVKSSVSDVEEEEEEEVEADVVEEVDIEEDEHDILL